MSALIDWNTTGQIFVESLGAGVLIVVAFAMGARLIASAHQGDDPSGPSIGGGPARAGGGGNGGGVAAKYALAAFFFAVAAVAVGFGVYFAIDK